MDGRTKCRACGPGFGPHRVTCPKVRWVLNQNGRQKDVRNRSARSDACCSEVAASRRASSLLGPSNVTKHAKNPMPRATPPAVLSQHTTENPTWEMDGMPLPKSQTVCGPDTDKTMSCVETYVRPYSFYK